MALRGIAGDVARNTAGIWKAVADAVDPKASRPSRPAEPVVEPAAAEATIDLDGGQMLVPIDAWTRILEQVGHVHEAGQQLADARERAVRAETENEFLKEQLRDLKSKKRASRNSSGPVMPPSTTADAGSPDPQSLRRAQVRRARETASRWLSPK